MVKSMDFGARIGRFNKWMMLVVYPFYLYLVRFQSGCCLPPLYAVRVGPFAETMPASLGQENANIPWDDFLWLAPKLACVCANVAHAYVAY